MCAITSAVNDIVKGLGEPEDMVADIVGLYRDSRALLHRCKARHDIPLEYTVAADVEGDALCSISRQPPAECEALVRLPCHIEHVFGEECFQPGFQGHLAFFH